MRALTYLFGLVGLLAAVPTAAQLTYPSSASAVDQTARDAAATAQVAAAAAVKSVAGTAPDGTGNVVLPSSFANTTCAGCTMSAPTFTGAATLNGKAIVTSVNALIPDGTGNIAVPTTTFVAGFTPALPGTWAGLASSAPCNAGRLSNYAIVSDLYSGTSATNEVARCTISGSNYYWRPQRTDFAANINTTGGTMTISCGVTAPTLFVAGTLATNFTVNAITTNCWPGAAFEIANNLNLGLYGVTLGGLIGGTAKTLGLNVRMRIVFDGTAFQAF